MALGTFHSYGRDSQTHIFVLDLGHAPAAQGLIQGRVTPEDPPAFPPLPALWVLPPASVVSPSLLVMLGHEANPDSGSPPILRGLAPVLDLERVLARPRPPPTGSSPMLYRFLLTQCVVVNNT
jgi:hypothetical protein